jgi:hypothetical protein
MKIENLSKLNLPGFLLEKLHQTELINKVIQDILDRVFEILIQNHISQELPNQVRSYFRDQIKEISFLNSLKKRNHLFKNKSPRLRIKIEDTERIKKDNWVRKEVPEQANTKLIGNSRIEKILKGDK